MICTNLFGDHPLSLLGDKQRVLSPWRPQPQLLPNDNRRIPPSPQRQWEVFTVVPVIVEWIVQRHLRRKPWRRQEVSVIAWQAEFSLEHCWGNTKGTWFNEKRLSSWAHHRGSSPSNTRLNNSHLIPQPHAVVDLFLPNVCGIIQWKHRSSHLFGTLVAIFVRCWEQNRIARAMWHVLGVGPSCKLAFATNVSNSISEGSRDCVTIYTKLPDFLSWHVVTDTHFLFRRFWANKQQLPLKWFDTFALHIGQVSWPTENSRPINPSALPRICSSIASVFHCDINGVFSGSTDNAASRFLCCLK